MTDGNRLDVTKSLTRNVGFTRGSRGVDIFMKRASHRFGSPGVERPKDSNGTIPIALK